MKKSRQLSMFKTTEKIYGGIHRNKAKGRGPRPIVTRSSMHLVLRSTQATGKKSFLTHHQKILRVVDKFAYKYGVKIISLANVGNHLHFHIKLSNRFTYPAFIRAITGAIAMAVSGAQRGQKLANRFWEGRPFTRVVIGFKDYLGMRDYILINQMESQGYARDHARLVVNEFARRSRFGQSG